MKLKNKTLQHLGFLALAFAGFASTTAHAATDTWQGTAGSTDWATDANWTYSTGSAIASGDSLVFTSANASASTTLTNTLATTFNVAAITYNSGALSYTMTGNAFNLPGGITNNGSNLQTINNDITLTNAAHVFSAASGDITLGGAISGTTIPTVTFSGAGTTTLSGTNTFNTKAGRFSALLVGGTGATPGNVSITGATTVDGTGFSDERGFLDIHGNSTLTVQTGGSFTINGSASTAANTFIGQNRTGTSTLRVNGGSLTVSGAQGFVLGNNRSDATGVLQFSSGTATITAGSTTRTDARSAIKLGLSSGNGRIDLDGGTLETGRYFLKGGTGTANFNFNGGTLKALADQTAGAGWFETVTTTVKVGGAKIDTNGFDTNINTVLAHDSSLGGTADGGLTKSGLGTLTLGAASSYTGKTTVSGGTLALGSSGSIADSSEIALNGGNFNVSAVGGYSTAAAQALTGSGSITGDITVTGTLAIGNSPGTMTFNDDLTLGISAISNFDLTNIAFGSGSYDLAQGGDGSQIVTFGGTLNLVFSGGTYANSSSVQIFDFENYSGAFTLVNFSGLGASQSAAFDASTGIVTVIPEPGAVLLGSIGMLALLRRRRN
jgi:autotransporter-associated beta strand protein